MPIVKFPFLYNNYFYIFEIVLKDGHYIYIIICHSTLHSLHHIIPSHLREHPFNLKGGGGGGFSVCKFDGKKILSLTWAEKNILFALWALKKYCFCRKKIMSRQLVVKKTFCLASKRKKKFYIYYKK